MKKNKSKVLALKYRPRVFKDLIGQEIIAETILNAIKINKTPNAYLLTGIRGVGKTTTARLIAKALNCLKESKEELICKNNDVCQNCIEIENSIHIDVLEMDAASKTGIDDVRELIESAKYNPTSAKYKIFIIDEIHMLSKQAFNGLLKTLEEPPEKLKFILATTEPRKIPITILSRCQRFDLKRVGLLQVFEHLKKISKLEGGKISDSAIKLLAKASEGSVRDGISLLDRALVFQSLNSEKIIEDNDIREMLGLADKTKLINLFENVIDRDEKNAIKLLEDLLEDGIDPKNFLNDILELIYLLGRRVNLGSIEKDLFLSETELELINKVSKNLKMEDLGIFWQLTLKTIEDLKIVSNENIGLEMYIMQLIHVSGLEKFDKVENLSENTPITEIMDEKKTEQTGIDLKHPNQVKNQLKNVEQIKTIEPKGIDISNKKDKKFAISSFTNLISLTEKLKEKELKYDLERNVKLVKFEEGKLDINFNENLNKNFIKNLSRKLFEWTGKRWIITLSNEEGLKTIHQTKIDEKIDLLNNEKKSETFKEVINAFPDAELIGVIKDDE